MGKDWKNKYKELLFNIDVPMSKVLEYIRLNVPKFLYKYRSFNGYWESVLFDGLLYFSDAISLNDPFDCHVYVNEKVFCEIMNIIAYKYVFQNISYDEISRVYNPRICDNLNRVRQEVKRDIQLTCFSERVDSILMWSHYADNHKGFCIEYDTEKIDLIYKRYLLPVIYQKEVYDYTMLAVQSDRSFILAMEYLNSDYNLNAVAKGVWIPLLIKAQEWYYEKEWRIILPSLFDDSSRLKDFGGAVNGVYLGANCDCDNTDVLRVVSWAKEKGINVYRMHTQTNKYELISSKL